MSSQAVKKMVIEEKTNENNIKDIGDFISEAERKEMSDNSSQKGEDPRIIPVKLTADEAKRAFAYQKTLLAYMVEQYKKVKGTEKEDVMRKLYEDSVRDYNNFISEYKEELSK